MKHKHIRRGFTLIELLVVVLIIGILAAVAVPQYQKAVLKSRFATVKEMAQSLANAEEVYYLANGKYTANFDALDIDLPPSEEEETDETTYSLRIFKNWQCRIYHGTTNSYANCGILKDGNGIMGYQVYMQHGTAAYVGQRWCVSVSVDLTSLANQVCKSETGKQEPSAKDSGATWKVWVY